MYGSGVNGTTYYGNRCVYFAGYNVNSGHNLFEGNRIGYASDSPDQGAVTQFLLSTESNIVRKNCIFHGQKSGIAMGLTNTYYSNIIYNKVYNNTLYNNGLNGDGTDENASFYLVDYSDSRVIQNNSFKNNIVYKHNYAWRAADGGTSVDLQEWAGNYIGEDSGDPLFTNASTALGDPTDSTTPDFRLQNTSPCINIGVALTTITSASGSGTTFTVAAAGYFTDGWGIEGVEGDEIQIVGTSQKARIVHVNYTSNTITVDATLTWTQGQGLALPYVGSAPDIGAHEYGSTSAIK
jgi:hypothetical protein